MIPGSGKPMATAYHGHLLVKVLEGGGYCEWYLFSRPISGEWGGRDKNRYRGIWGRWFFSKPEAVETITTDVLDLGTCISERT